MDIMVYLINISDKSFDDIINSYQKFLTSSDIKKAQEFKFDTNKKQTLISCVLKNKYINGDIYYNEHGKPLTKETYFNISHSDDFVLLVKSSEVEVGIDVEHIKEEINDDLIKRIFSDKEKEFIINDKYKNFYYLWTRKEAILKCKGVGLVNDLKSIEVLNDNGEFKLSSYFIDDYVFTIAIKNDGMDRKIEIIRE